MLIILLISTLFIKSNEFEYNYNIYIDCSKSFALFFLKSDRDNCDTKLKEYCSSRLKGIIDEEISTFSFYTFGSNYVFANCKTNAEFKLNTDETIGFVLKFEANKYHMENLSKNTCKKIGGIDLNISFLHEINSYIVTCMFKE